MCYEGLDKSEVRSMIDAFRKRKPVPQEVKELADFLLCPQCLKPVPQHKSTEAYECLYVLAMNHQREHPDFITKSQAALESLS